MGRKCQVTASHLPSPSEGGSEAQKERLEAREGGRKGREPTCMEVDGKGWDALVGLNLTKVGIAWSIWSLGIGVPIRYHLPNECSTNDCTLHLSACQTRPVQAVFCMRLSLPLSLLDSRVSGSPSPCMFTSTLMCVHLASRRSRPGSAVGCSVIRSFIYLTDSRSRVEES
ncbi:hypothetical protein BDP81DRAFT_22735 [Colletotrichum phormii]|uniref:Uncharacterized protein n=1 Tax=Colletotrichum phormii TaxID=359342 RepID=A0AAI9ZQN3_9PEZI|nr:uncharacterized protein BDP81DRAFT_22735 [Colletotrichum phormii]KAK1636432.1 hypothetical protein BDP81DRAFT_22735 [Colletotrichum phormii]